MIQQSFFKSNTIKFVWSYLPLPITRQGALEGEFAIQYENECKLRRCLLIENYLCCYTKRGAIKWINYENTILEIVHDKMMKDGIRLQNQDQIVLYGDIEIWVNYMKRCIFKIVDKIGKGNQAEVYSCKYLSGEGEFAVKLFQKYKLTDTTDKLALQKEITILRHIQHDNIIQLFEIFENDDTIYVVMEYFKGGDLATYLKQLPYLNEQQIARFIYLLLKTLAFIHKHQIMHRDLKPKNIILRQKKLDSFCLTDFGLADYFNKEGKYLFKRCGTPGYVAPEILRDEQYDFKVDIFSVGVILYIIITGEEPFPGEYNEAITKNYIGDVDLSQLKFSELGIQFLKSLLEPQELRPTAKQAMNHYWFKNTKIVKEKPFKIKIQEPQIKVHAPIPSARECISTSQLFRSRLMSGQKTTTRLAPISTKNTPNPSPKFRLQPSPVNNKQLKYTHSPNFKRTLFI